MDTRRKARLAPVTADGPIPAASSVPSGPSPAWSGGGGGGSGGGGGGTGMLPPRPPPAPTSIEAEASGVARGAGAAGARIGLGAQCIPWLVGDGVAMAIFLPLVGLGAGPVSAAVRRATAFLADWARRANLRDQSTSIAKTATKVRTDVTRTTRTK